MLARVRLNCDQEDISECLLTIASQNPEQEPAGEPHGQPGHSGNGHSTKGVPGSAAALGLDLNVSIMALRAMNPDGYQHFMFLNPAHGQKFGLDIRARALAEKRALIEAEQDKGNNAYFCVNEPSPAGTDRAPGG